jgi:3-isopropylmalate/(R)-2-methylmalate dehydratase large subunit
MSEKILSKASGNVALKPGDIVWAEVDRAMMDDILGPRIEIAEKMEYLRASVKDPDRVVIISDHYTPPASVNQAEIVKFTRDWASAHGIRQYYEFDGPCHQVMVETGNVLPGTLILGTDSHTCMGGAFGAFASGVGSTEMLGILVTGQTWLRVPETMRVIWKGRLQNGVMAKDVSLKTIGCIGHAGATYRAVEYAGSLIDSLCMDERMAITNMAVEMGAKAGLMHADEVTVGYLREIGSGDYTIMNSDPDAVYESTFTFDADTLTPQVACPHEVDNVVSVGQLAPTDIHQAYLGSCTGGRMNDLRQAAKLLKGKRIAKGVRFLVSPASRRIWEQANEEGCLGILVAAGATVLASTCGACVGLHSGLIAAGENCISSSNRNFIGRMGSKNGNIYLASPLTVAASAIKGKITDPRELIEDRYEANVL